MEKDIRKTVSLPPSLWERVADYRFTKRISAESEAVRRLIIAGLEVDDEIQQMRAALEQAQCCLLDETPENGVTHEEARADTLEKIRRALVS